MQHMQKDTIKPIEISFLFVQIIIISMKYFEIRILSQIEKFYVDNLFFDFQFFVWLWKPFSLMNKLQK